MMQPRRAGMVVAPFGSGELTARTFEQQKPPGKPAVFCFVEIEKLNMRRALLNPNPCATSPDGRRPSPSPVGSDRATIT